MHELGQVYLCPYRSNGRTHTARIRARSLSEASRKLARLDWAPGCGPIGDPRALPEATEQASPRQLLHALSGLARRVAPGLP